MIRDLLKENEEAFEHFYDEHNPRDRVLKRMHEALTMLTTKVEELEVDVDRENTDDR